MLLSQTDRIEVGIRGDVAVGDDDDAFLLPVIEIQRGEGEFIVGAEGLHRGEGIDVEVPSGALIPG